MSDWRAWGTEHLDRFDAELSPTNLHLTLKDYRCELGTEFTLNDLIRIQEIRSRAMIAAAICDFPEFFFEQLGMMQNDWDVPTIAKSIDHLAETLESHFA